MGAYTKEQFEVYKGEDEFLEVVYYSEYDTSKYVAVKHESYEEYIDYFNNWAAEKEGCVVIC